MHRTITLIAISLMGCDSPQEEREDALEEVQDAMQEAQEAGLDLQVVDSAMINNLVPPDCTVVGSPMRGTIGDDTEDATYFITHRSDGRIMAHRTRDNETVESRNVTPYRASEVTGVETDKDEDGKIRISVAYRGVDEQGEEYEDSAVISADNTRMQRVEPEEPAYTRTWNSQYLDETLAYAMACTQRQEMANEDDIDSNPLDLVKGAVIAPGEGATFSVTLPAVNAHDLLTETVSVDAAAERCDGMDASDKQPVTHINHYLASDVLSHARDCASEVTESSAYGSMAPSLTLDEKSQWLANFGGDSPLTVKLEYDGTELTECTRMDG